MQIIPQTLSPDLVQRVQDMLDQDPMSDMQDVFQTLAQRHMQAQANAQAAQSQLQGAISQPLPTTNPMADAVLRAFGGGASAFEGNPEPRQRAEDLIHGEQQRLLLQRTQDISRLSDIYDRSVQRAEKLGDDDTAAQLMMKKEKLNADKMYLLGLIQSQTRLGAAATTAQGRVDAAEIRGPSAGAGGSLIQWAPKVQQSPITGTNYIDMSNLPAGKFRDDQGHVGTAQGIASEFIQQHPDQKISALTKEGSSAIPLLNASAADMETARGIIPKLVTNPYDILGRTKNFLAAQAGTDPVLGGYQAMRTGAIRTIQSIASLGKGLRINQAEIRAAQNFDLPRVTDPQDVANEKLRLLGLMQKHTELAALGIDARDPKENAQFAKDYAAVVAKSNMFADQIKTGAAQVQQKNNIDQFLEGQGAQPKPGGR